MRSKPTRQLASDEKFWEREQAVDIDADNSQFSIMWLEYTLIMLIVDC